MKTNCEPQDFEATNRDLFSALQNAGTGFVKGASDGSTEYVRTHMLERGYARTLQPPKTPDASKLRRYPDNENQDIMDEMQPGAEAAGTLNMNSAPEITMFYADRFLTRFFDISTRKHQKNLRQLEGIYDMDLRQIVTDQAMNQIEILEDTLYTRLTDAVVGTAANFTLGMTGQNVVFNTGGMSPKNYNNAMNLMNDDRIIANQAVINKTTWSQVAAFPATQVGADLAEKFFREGAGGLDKARIYGVNHLITIKSDIVGNGVVYLYTEPAYLGKFYVKMEPTMYVDKKDDIISFYAKETIGFSIANTRGVRKITFSDVYISVST